jgi:hypothetical protein
MFQCPATGQNVEVWHEVDDDPALADASIEPVVCRACGNIHLVDAKSGRVITATNE